MDCNVRLKYMSHLSTMCCSSSFNTQVLFYDLQDIHFDERELNTLQIHHIHDFILNSGESVHDHTKNNGPNLNLKNLYGYSRMNCTSNNRTFKFMTDHMNDVLFETWKYFKL